MLAPKASTLFWITFIVIVFILYAFSTGNAPKSPYKLAVENECSIIIPKSAAQNSEQVNQYMSKTLLTELKFFKEKIPVSVFNETSGLASQVYLGGCFSDNPHDRTEAGVPLRANLQERNNLWHYAHLDIYPNNNFRLVIANNHIEKIYGEPLISDNTSHEPKEQYEECLSKNILAHPEMGKFNYEDFANYFNNKCKIKINTYLSSDRECLQYVDGCRSYIPQAPIMMVSRLFILPKDFRSSCLGALDMNTCTLHDYYLYGQQIQ